MTARPGGPPPQEDSFLSGESGRVAGPRLTVTRTLGDWGLALLDRVGRTGARLDRLAALVEPRDVLVVSAYRPGSRLAAQIAHLGSDRHRVELALGATGASEPGLEEATRLERLQGGKFQNLNRLVAETAGAEAFDWVLAVDDDVRLPQRFLDRFLAVCERVGLQLAQPAQSMRSHAAWGVTRRRPLSLVRETRFVEIGPVTAFARAAAGELIPFPELRYGWGLDLHWAAVAAERGWRLGVVDAVAVRHEDAPVGSAYGHADAKAEAAAFLTGRPYLRSAAAGETLTTHRRLPP